MGLSSTLYAVALCTAQPLVLNLFNPTDLKKAVFDETGDRVYVLENESRKILSYNTESKKSFDRQRLKATWYEAKEPILNFGTTYPNSEQEPKMVYSLEKGENNVKILRRQGKKLMLEYVLFFPTDYEDNNGDFTVAYDLMYRRDVFFFMKSMTLEKIALQEKSMYNL